MGTFKDSYVANAASTTARLEKFRKLETKNTIKFQVIE